MNTSLKEKAAPRRNPKTLERQFVYIRQFRYINKKGVSATSTRAPSIIRVQMQVRVIKVWTSFEGTPIYKAVSCDAEVDGFLRKNAHPTVKEIYFFERDIA